jgi:hypothetical protein
MSVLLQNFTSRSAYTVAATGSSSNTALTQIAGSGGGNSDVVVYNASSAVAFLSFGMTSQTATTAAPYQVAPGAVMAFNIGAPYTNVGVILASGSGSVYIMLGGGN